MFLGCADARTAKLFILVSDRERKITAAQRDANMRRIVNWLRHDDFGSRNDTSRLRSIVGLLRSIVGLLRCVVSRSRCDVNRRRNVANPVVGPRLISSVFNVLIAMIAVPMFMVDSIVVIPMIVVIGANNIPLGVGRPNKQQQRADRGQTCNCP